MTSDGYKIQAIRSVICCVVDILFCRCLIYLLIYAESLSDSLKMRVEGAVIVSQDQKYLAATDSKGYYRINRIAAGTFTITCPGYNPLETVITFAPATASKGDFELTKVLAKVA